MTPHDGFWRATGAVMIAAGYAATHGAIGAGLGAIAGPIGFLIAAAGLLLLAGGRRVPLALRIERSRHRELPAAIRASRHARRTHH